MGESEGSDPYPVPMMCQGLYILQAGPWLRGVQGLAQVTQQSDHLHSEPSEVRVPVTPILQNRGRRHRKAIWL